MKEEKRVIKMESEAKESMGRSRDRGRCLPLELRYLFLIFQIAFSDKTILRMFSESLKTTKILYIGSSIRLYKICY